MFDEMFGAFDHPRSNIERFWLFFQLQCSVKCSVCLALALEAEWSTKVSAAALRSLGDQQFNKTPILPLTGDLIKLREFLTEEIPASTQKLLSQPTLQEWRSLAGLTVGNIRIFNKRGGNEGSKILITQCTDPPKWTDINMDEMS